LSVGGIIGAMINMYAAVPSRTAEIGTLNAEIGAKSLAGGFLPAQRAWASSTSCAWRDQRGLARCANRQYNR